MGGEGEGFGEGAISLLQTPTWAIATVCFVFIFLGVFVEHLIDLMGHWLKKHKKAALSDAMEKLKSVLMLLGFMSLTLTVTQGNILKICIPNKVAHSMLPCRRSEASTTQEKHIQRELATVALDYGDHCTKGMTPLMSKDGINQLNIFIFVLAVMQIVSSVATMALGRAKMKRWKTWEKETQTLDYTIANDPERFRFARETTFGRRHAISSETNAALLWMKCFLHQFFRSVAKIDYITLRHGFISAHLPTTNTFNFQKYIQRSLEDDFKAVIGISPIMWLMVVIFLVLDVHGWNVYLWISFVPLIIVLFIGTKLEVIMAKMAIRLTSQNTIIRGSPVVQPNDNLFWFKHPQLILALLHFALFMNAFEFAFFQWVTWQFGIRSCYHEYVAIIVIRVVLVVLVQIICSYVTLPLYALVTQMGSQYKTTILEVQTAEAIRRWHENVKRKGNVEPMARFSIQQDASTTRESNMGRTTSNISSNEQIKYMTSFVSLNGSDIIEDLEIYNQYHIEISQGISEHEIQHDPSGE